MALYWGLVMSVLLLVRPSSCQINMVPGTSQTAFYLDSAADCDGRIREVGQSTVSIFSSGSQGNTGAATTSCTLTLNTENIREPHRFKIQFLAVRIDNPNVNLYVYDGEFNGRLKWQFSQMRQKPQDLDFDFSTGQLVTFRFTRGEREFNYDIRIVVTPIPGDVARCTYENEYGCDDYGYNYRLLGTKEIVGIVAGGFALVVLIVIIVVICCYRNQRGISKKWTETKLGHVNTAASLHTLNGKVPSESTTSKVPWTSESSKNGFASIRRSPNLPRAKIGKSRLTDQDISMSDSHASLPSKRPLPAPSHVSSNPRGTSSRGRRSRFDRDSDRYSDQSFSDKSYSEKNFSERNFSERNYRPPTYREALRNDESDYSADEHSFVQANDDHPQKVFVERVITPRVKPKRTSPILQRAPPPPEEDETYDSIDPKARDRKKLLTKGTVMDDESDTDNESDLSEEEESEEEEEESEEENEKPDDEADKAEYSTPHKSRKSKPTNQPPPPPVPQHKGAFVPLPQSQPQQFPGGQYPGYPPPQGIHHPQPMYGYPPQGQHFPQGQPAFHPQGQQPFHPQGQPFPQQPAQGQQQPYPHPYHQANFSVPLTQSGPGPAMMNQPPSYHGNAGSKPQRERSHKPRTDPGQVNPGHLPVYSYLVNRGYQPVDGRHSPISTSTGASNMSGDRNMPGEDSDYSANIGAGVEVLRRKN